MLEEDPASTTRPPVACATGGVVFAVDGVMLDSVSEAMVLANSPWREEYPPPHLLVDVHELAFPCEVIGRPPVGCSTGISGTIPDQGHSPDEQEQCIVEIYVLTRLPPPPFRKP